VGFFPRFALERERAAQERVQHKESKMKTKLLVAGLACLSVVAVAQQSAGTEKPSSKTSSAAAHTATTGKTTASTTATNGNKSAQDDWQQTRVAAGNNTNQNGSTSGNAGQATMVRESPSKASLGAVRESPSKGSLSSGHVSTTKASTSVSAGDVNGDGMARDVATGKATGKRQHQPMTVSKSVDKASPK
jgi:hypothetical protein